MKPKPCPFCGFIGAYKEKRGCGYDEYLCDDTEGYECGNCDTWSSNWPMEDEETK